jgi:Glycosyltransferase family 87/WD40-like Beta Propeller Repeat
MTNADQNSVANPLPPALRSVMPWIESVVVFALAALLLLKGILPAWHVLNTDFPNYYLVARLIHEGFSLDRIYDWIWLQRIKDHWGVPQALVSFVGLTPLSALPVLPLAILPALVAKRIWIAANIVMLAVCIELLCRVTSLGRRRIWLLALLAIFPLRTSFLDGQMHLLVLLCLVLAYFFHRKDMRIACGLCLSLAGALKVYPLLFGLYFCWKRQWRTALAIFFSALAVAGIGSLWTGTEILHFYAVHELPRNLIGEGIDAFNVRAASASALLHRMFIFEPEQNPHPFINSPLLYAVFYPLWQLAVLFPLFAAILPRVSKAATEHLEWAAYTLALLLLSPIPSSYHFVVMIFPVILFADVLQSQKKYGSLAVAVFLYFLVSIAAFAPPNDGGRFSLLTLAAFVRLWAGLGLLAFCIFHLWRQEPRSKPLLADFSRAVPLCAFAALIWFAGFFNYRHHFAFFPEDWQRHIPPQASSMIFANGIQANPCGGYLYTAMVGDGYHTLDQSGHSLLPQADGADELSSAVAGSTCTPVVELADASGSHIVKMTPAGNTALVSNAESPAFSSDGQLMAFLRENRGHGTLWLMALQPSPGAAAQIVDDSYDVRDVTFAGSGQWLFTAKRNGQLGIYRIASGSSPSLISASGENVEAPSVSQDGKRIAYERLIHNRWQLGYLDTATHEEKILTSGDCNARRPAWLNTDTIGYASDCGRGVDLTVLSSVKISR